MAFEEVGDPARAPLATASAVSKFTSHGLPRFRSGRDPPAEVARSSVAMTSPTSRISAAPMPRVVTAGVPNRRPLVYQAPLASNGTGCG